MIWSKEVAALADEETKKADKEASNKTSSVASLYRCNDFMNQ